MGNVKADLREQLFSTGAPHELSIRGALTSFPADCHIEKMTKSNMTIEQNFCQIGNKIIFQCIAEILVIRLCVPGEEKG